jgi:transcriptional pleiotropic regulator of transition state genes
MVESVGIVRIIDELGRIVIPIELRRTLGIELKDGLEFYVDDAKIMLKRYMPACVFCGDADQVFHFKGKMLCQSCTTELLAL